MDLLSSALHGMLTSGATPWFHLDIKDENIGRDDEVKEFLENASMSMMRGFNRSNFENEVHSLYVDLVVFGTGCMLLKWKTTHLDFLHDIYQSSLYKKISLEWLIQFLENTNHLFDKSCKDLALIM